MESNNIATNDLEIQNSKVKVQHKLSDLEKEEFQVKKFSLTLFFWSSLSYLIMTLVRGKGSLPMWV